VVEDRVFVHAGPARSRAKLAQCSPSTGRRRTLAADAAGWRRRVIWVSPVVHRGSVYVGGLDGVYALDARDGSPRWSRETSGSVNEAVLGRDDRVFASTGETLLALDTRGQEGWTYTTGDDRFSTAAPRLAAATSSTRHGCLGASSPSSPALLGTR